MGRLNLNAVLLDPTHPAVISEMERIAGTFDPNREWVNKNGTPYRLSDRVWDAGQSQRDQIDKFLQNAMRTGEDALVTARKLETYLLPGLQPLRGPTGRLKPGQPKRIVTATPGRGGKGSYAARRLTRTEIARAHTEATMQAGAMNPFLETVGYRVSPQHPEADECDAFAERDTGWGPGNYQPRDVPGPPIHPHCLCYLTNNVSKNSAAVVDALRLRYNLGTPAADDFVFPTDRVLAPVDRSMKAAGQKVLDRGRVEANARARTLFQRASTTEPAITKDILAVADKTGAHMEGLDFRLKTESSTSRKLLGDSIDNRTTIEDAATKVYDNVRYTYLTDAGNYDAMVARSRIELEEAGYTPVRQRNYWANQSGYSGVNDIWQASNGQYFEVQFHTPESIYTKEKISHPLYEKQRLLAKGSPEYEAIGRQIDTAWSELRAANSDLGTTIEGHHTELLDSRARAAARAENVRRIAERFDAEDAAQAAEAAVRATAQAERLATERAAAAARAATQTAEQLARTVEWSPTMSPADADIWRRRSAYTDDVFHGTKVESVASIEADGFIVSEKARWARAWGNGVYSTPEFDLAEQYAQHGGSVLRIAVKVDNPLILNIDANNFFSAVSEIIAGAPDKLKAGRILQAFEDRVTVQKAEIAAEQAKMAGFNFRDPVAAEKWEALIARKTELDAPVLRIEALLDGLGYDSVVINSTRAGEIDKIGGSQIVVRDPRHVTVIKD